MQLANIQTLLVQQIVHVSAMRIQYLFCFETKCIASFGTRFLEEICTSRSVWDFSEQIVENFTATRHQCAAKELWIWDSSRSLFVRNKIPKFVQRIYHQTIHSSLFLWNIKSLKLWMRWTTLTPLSVKTRNVYSSGQSLNCSQFHGFIYECCAWRPRQKNTKFSSFIHSAINICDSQITLNSWSCVFCSLWNRNFCRDWRSDNLFT